MRIEGPRLALVPLTRTHLRPFCAVGLKPALWKATAIRVRTKGEMSRYVGAALEAKQAGTALPFAIVLKETGQVIGTTRYHSIVHCHRRLEIGYTWIGLEWQRKGYSTESKYLLLKKAFEDDGIRRVEFKADSRNTASCKAILGLGAKREGLLRSYMLSPHRGPRDMALFSVIAPDWPDVKRRLLKKLGIAG